MKKLHKVKQFGFLLLLLIGLGARSRTKACMDVIPKVHSMVVHYDSSYWQDLVIRIGSLRMLGNAPGTFCTCAIHNPAPLLDLIDYIALVDSGTNHRVDGVAPWYAWSAASSGWDSIYQITWDGFLSQIEGAGTVAGTPVELIVRAHFPVGYAYIPMVDDLYNSLLGWGTWNETTLRPNPDRWWVDLPGDSTLDYIAVIAPSSFFINFDEDLVYTGLPGMTMASDLEVFPNPVGDLLHLRWKRRNAGLQSWEVYDLQGHLLLQDNVPSMQSATADVSGLTAGTYLLKVNTNKGAVNKKFVVQ